jgi:biopolymer transport protein ExbB
MVANVATLIGLLGTVIGLIMSFKAVSFADVSQKQTLLADGISLAMHSTAIGLLVAIPTMVFYSFLHDKQSKLFAEIDLCTSQVVEFLRLRGYKPFNQNTVFPNNVGTGKMSAMMGKNPPTRVS